MFGFNPYLIEETLAQSRRLQPDQDIREFQTASQLYRQVLFMAGMRRLWSILTRRSDRPINVAVVEASCRIISRSYAGIQTVPLSRILGSEGHHRDFDRDFRPLHDRTRERWLRVAVAYQRGASLPPVELIQLGDFYFVRDGHHRISAARALGQGYIEAEVILWKADCAFPWEQPAPARQLGRAAPQHSPS